MFNRRLQVDLVKKDNPYKDGSDKNEIGFERKTKIVVNAFERGIKKIGFAMCAYVVLDTIRKVTIEKASK